MAALSADVHIPHLGTPTKMTVRALGADTFYAGSLVFADSTGGLAQLVPAVNDTFLGICAKQVTTTAALDPVEIYVDGIHALAFIGAADVDAGKVVFQDIDGTQSDNETDLVAELDGPPVAGDILIGKCLGLNTEETSRGWVLLHTASGSANVLGWL
jgi:hypothetical protein